MSKYKTSIFFVSILLLIFFEFLTVFLKSPLRFNQDLEGTVEFTHFLNMNFKYLRILLLGVVIWSALGVFKNAKKYQKILAGFLSVLYIGLFILANYFAQVDSYFKDQKITVSEPVSKSTVAEDNVVMGIVVDGQPRAYPIDYLAFHHKISDKIGDKPVFATYCSVCRSGRVFSPVIDGRAESFRLVGMLNFNAIIEDATTKSWWQQATGEAIAGKRKGMVMEEIPSEQMALDKWIAKYPNTMILQPDSTFTSTYEEYEGFGTGYGSVNARADSSWMPTSWVVGVVKDSLSAAFDYRELTEHRVLNDFLGDMPITVTLEKDTVSFHAWDTRVDTLALTFNYHPVTGEFIDDQTLSTWDMSGNCVSGALEGKQLNGLQSYVEYWHSWERFHPDTKKVINDN